VTVVGGGSHRCVLGFVHSSKTWGTLLFMRTDLDLFCNHFRCCFTSAFWHLYFNFSSS
jgi:hypothetical protein